MLPHTYNPDDFTLRVTDGDTGTRIGIPRIHNSSQYSDAQYLSYVSYKANGGQLTIHDFVGVDRPSVGATDRASIMRPNGGPQLPYTMGPNDGPQLEASGLHLVMRLGGLRIQYGVNETNLAVEATFEHQGKLFYDVNQTARNPALATDAPLPIYSESRARLGAPNQTRADAHAEVGAIAQSYEAGARGERYADIIGKDACSYCLSDVKRMALRLQLNELTVIQPSGTVKFTGPQDFAPVKLGGEEVG